MGWARFKTLVIDNLFWIFLGTAILISLALASPSNAQAAVLFQGGDVEYPAHNSFGGSCNTWPLVFGGSGDLTDGTFHSSGTTGSGQAFFVLMDSSHNLIASSSFFSYDSGTSGILNFSFLSPIYVNDSDTYYFGFRADGGSGLGVDSTSNGAVIGSYPSKNRWDSGYVSYQYCDNAPYNEGSDGAEPSFTLNSTPAGPPPQTIDISAFLNDTGYGAWWVVDYNAATTTTYEAYTGPFYEIDLTAGNTTSSYQDTLVGRQDLTQTTSGADASTTIPAYQGFAPGITYYAQGELIFHQNWGDSGLLVATSSIFTFSVPFPTTPGYFPASTTTAPTSTISTTNVCDPNAFFLIYGVCRLFVPQASDFVIFNIMKSYVQNKPPFGYIGLTVSALQNLNSGTPGFWFPDLTAYALVLDPVRTGINMLLWILFVFWLFYKFRNIEL